MQRRSSFLLEPIVGRSDELTRVMSRLGTARFTCITGPGGTGKTRLAIEVADRLADMERDSELVDLSAERDPNMIETAIVAAVALDVPSGQQPRQALEAHFRDRDTVLILDNLEQIDGAGDAILGLLASLPSIRVLATSRIHIGLPGEAEIKLGPLGLPSEDSPAEVEASPSGELFLRRARAHGAVRSLDDLAARDLTRLLRQLDGLPLAIELAAARTKLITLSEVIDRVDRLGIGAIDRPVAGTQKSVRRIVEWTIGLLSPHELELLSGACEAAGFDVRLADALAPRGDTLDAIEGLLDAGLIQRRDEATGPTRFDVLETVRSVVRLRTDEADRGVFVERLALNVGDWIEMAAPAAEQDSTILASLDAEAANVRRALDWFGDRDPTRALHLWNLLFYPFWARQGRMLEGMARFERISASLKAPNVELARAMVRYAMNQLWVSDESSTRTAMSRAVDVARSVGDTTSEIEALAALGGTAANEGDAQLAEVILDRLGELGSESLSNELKMRIAEARHHAAVVIHGQRSDEALTLLLQAISFAVLADQPRAAAAMTGNLAIARLHRHEATEAVVAAARSVALCRSTGSPLLAWSLCALAMSHAMEGEAESARQALSDAIVETEAMSMPVQICDTLLAALPVAVVSQRPALAATVWGAAQAMEASGSADIPQDDRELAERSIRRVRALLSPVDYDVAMRTGAARDPIALLRALPQALENTKAASRSKRSLRHGEMTPREVEVMRLVGMGQTDRQIAEALFISPKTASVHVSNVKGKLGAASRLEVALRAREIGLVDDASASDELRATATKEQERRN